MNSEPRASEEEALSTPPPDLGFALIQLESFKNVQCDLERATFPVNIPIHHNIVKLIKSKIIHGNQNNSMHMIVNKVLKNV